jgi:hypothetical protein
LEVRLVNDREGKGGKTGPSQNKGSAAAGKAGTRDSFLVERGKIKNQTHTKGISNQNA